jgi:hypothetical protein
MLFILRQSQNQLLPSALLEEQVAVEENAKARKMILTGGPGSRRFDFKLCDFEVTFVMPQKVGRE